MSTDPHAAPRARRRVRIEHESQIVPRAPVRTIDDFLHQRGQVRAGIRLSGREHRERPLHAGRRQRRPLAQLGRRTAGERRRARRYRLGTPGEQPAPRRDPAGAPSRTPRRARHQPGRSLVTAELRPHRTHRALRRGSLGVRQPRGGTYDRDRIARRRLRHRGRRLRRIHRSGCHVPFRPRSRQPRDPRRHEHHGPYRRDLRRGCRRDHRSDITAICAMVYFCLTGQNPGHLQDQRGRPIHRTPGHSVREVLGDDPRAESVELFLDREEFEVFWQEHVRLPLKKLQFRFVRRDGLPHSPFCRRDCISVDLFMSRAVRSEFLTLMKEKLPYARFNRGKHSM